MSATMHNETRAASGNPAGRWGRALARSPILWVGLATLVFLIAVDVLALWIAPYALSAQHMTSVSDLEPSAHHWFGADSLHRDILSRIVWRAHPVSLACAYLVAISAGLAAGYKGGWVDEVVSRAVDVLLSFPKIVIYVVPIASLGLSASVVPASDYVGGAGGADASHKP